MRLNQWRIFDDPILDGYFYTPEQQGLMIANAAAAREPIPYAEKAPSGDVNREQAKAEGVVMFSQWLEKSAPEIYKQIVITMPEELLPEFALAGMTLSGLGQDAANPNEPQTSWGDKISSFIDNVLALAPQYAAYRAQRDLIKLNITRAEQGLPPLESGDVAPQVRVGMTADTKNLLIFGGLGLAAVLLLARQRR